RRRHLGNGRAGNGWHRNLLTLGLRMFTATTWAMSSALVQDEERTMLRSTRIRHAQPFLFIGNVGEEGEGDLRGMRHIFSIPRWKEAIRYNLVLDGAGSDTIVAEALGSRRFEVIVRGPGGHSWSDFGAPNPIVVLARAIQSFAQTPVPASPKT